jgi:alcohol dehydrogenase
MPIPDFDFDPRQRVLFGAGSLQRLGEMAQTLGAHALLVTDSGLKAAGHEERALQSLAQAGLRVSLYDEVRPNPTTRDSPGRWGSISSSVWGAAAVWTAPRGSTSC